MLSSPTSVDRSRHVVVRLCIRDGRISVGQSSDGRRIDLGVATPADGAAIHIVSSHTRDGLAVQFNSTEWLEPEATVMLKLAEAVVAGEPESVTLTVKLEVPAVVGDT